MRLGTAFITGWFLAAFGLSASGWFERFSAGALFTVGSVVSATGFAVLHTLSPTFRGFLRGRSLKLLTMAQALRFYGALALVKANENVLPAVFAVPTGVMDLTVALFSFLVAAKLVAPKGSAKPGFVAFHIMGVLSLAVSVVLAMLTSSEKFGLVSGGVTSQAMSHFPMSLVPTFVGPMVLIFHLLVLSAVLLPEAEIPPARPVRLTRV